MPTVVVAGSAGALSEAVVRRIARDRQVRWVLPPDAEPASQLPASVRLHVEDLGRRFALPKLLESSPAVVYIPPSLEPGSRDRDACFTTLLEHPGHLLTAAREAHVSKLVFMTHPVAFGSARQGVPLDLGAPWDLGDVHLPAVQATRLAALEAWRQGSLGLPLVMVVPPWLIGPGAEGPIGRLVQGQAPAWLRRLPSTPVEVMDTRDLAAVLAEALNAPAGAVWHPCGHQSTLDGLLGHTQGASPTLPVGPAGLRALGGVLATLGSRKTAGLMALMSRSWAHPTEGRLRVELRPLSDSRAQG